MIVLSELIHKYSKRTIAKSKFDGLVYSLFKHPDLLEGNRIKIDSNNNIIDGSSRVKALIKLGYYVAPEKWFDIMEIEESDAKRLAKISNKTFAEFEEEAFDDEWKDLAFEVKGIAPKKRIEKKNQKVTFKFQSKEDYIFVVESFLMIGNTYSEGLLTIINYQE